MERIDDIEERSPLDDYFHDVDQDLQEPDNTSLTGKIAVRGMDELQSDTAWGDETLVDVPPTPPKGWTGSQLNTPGPSSPRQSPLADSTEAFAEKFKYLVCSSGLLEKDFVKPVVPTASDVAGSVEEAEVIPTSLSEEKVSSGALAWQWWITKVMDRWDIGLAGIVLLGAVMVVLGWKKVVGTMASLVVGVVAAEGWQRGQIKKPPLEAMIPESESSSPSKQLQPKEIALQSLESLISTSDLLDATLTSTLSILLHSTPLPKLQSALHNLCGEMTDHIATATSSSTPLIDEGEMKVLSEMYDIPLEGRRPRNRLSAGTQSSTTDDMGDIEVYGSRLGNRYPALGIGSVPSPRRDRPIPLQLGSSSSPSTIRNLSFISRLSPLLGGESLGMSSTRSLPSHVATRHVRHISMLSHESSDINDHFTSIPQRTPRLSKRASWDVGHKRRMSSDGDKGLLAAWKRDDGSCMKRSGSGRRVVHEKRITEADEEDGELGWSSTSGEEPSDTDDLPLPYIPTSASNGLRILSLPSSPTLSSPRVTPSLHTPKYTSPLTGRRPPPEPQTPIRHITPSLTESAIRLASISHPSPPLFTPLRQSHSQRLSLNISPPTGNPKRRSLGNIPYCHQPLSPSISYTGGENMSRTRSLQSDLQNARTRSATGGSKSRRTSMSTSVSALPSSSLLRREDVEMVNSPRQPHRIPSVSPLSTPALQAACLGIHMKRRKVACGLLALRWNETSEGYWEDVTDVLDKLKEGIQVEVDKLDEVLRGISAESEKLQKSLTPPWITFPSRLTVNPGTTNGEFAPITSAHEKLGNHVIVIQKALARAWEETIMVQRHLANGDMDENGISRNWAGLRDELGIMIREIERGKETISTLSTHSTSDPVVERIEDITPDFLRTWEQEDDTHIARSTSGTTAPTTDISSPTPQIEDEFMPEILVPAGADEIFEADLSEISGRRENGLSGLGREERMGLMRSAREQGMTLCEYVRLRDDGGVMEKKGMEEGGRKVVDELKGVIGLIRDKKDLARGVEEEERIKENLPFSRFITKEQPLDTNSDIAPFGLSGIDLLVDEGDMKEKKDIQEELKRAFAFPFRPLGEFE